MPHDRSHAFEWFSSRRREGLVLHGSARSSAAWPAAQRHGCGECDGRTNLGFSVSDRLSFLHAVQRHEQYPSGQFGTVSDRIAIRCLAAMCDR